MQRIASYVSFAAQRFVTLSKATGVISGVLMHPISYIPVVLQNNSRGWGDLVLIFKRPAYKERVLTILKNS